MLALLLVVAAGLSSQPVAGVFEVSNTLPNSPIPYIVRHLDGPKFLLADDVFRTLTNAATTTNGSGNNAANGFSILLTSGKVDQIVPAHYHRHWHELFIPTSGHTRVWVNGKSRDLTEGDFAMVPHYVPHSYQLVGSESEFVGFVQPAGFDEFFANISTLWSPAYNVPYPPDEDIPFPGAALASVENEYDINPVSMPTPEPSVSPDWYENNATLPADAKTPYYVANGEGSHWWYEELGAAISPLATAVQSNGNFTISQVSMRKSVNMTVPKWKSGSHQFLYGMTGAVTVQVGSDEPVQLIRGDAMFIPAYTNFTIENCGNYNKFLWCSGGWDGIDSQMVEGGTPWGYASPPAHY